MRIAFFSTRPYDRSSFEKFNPGHEPTFFEFPLEEATAALAEGHEAVCAFVNDNLGSAVLERLAELKVRVIALRCAGFNNVDLKAVDRLGLTVVRVPEYSPYAVAEHAVGLILALNRKLYKAYNRVREGNFSLNGLLGFDLHGKTVGVVGTGRIGATFARIIQGFGTRVLAHDPYPSKELQGIVEYKPLEELFGLSDILSLHCPLMPETFHLVDEKSISRMRKGVMLINTSRGALIDTQAVVKALKSGHIAYLGLDVYEEEAHLFFEDLSSRVITDDVFARLLTFPNVLITGHQAFFTDNALETIARVTYDNLSCLEAGRECANIVHTRKALA